MARQDLPLSGLTPATSPLSGDDLILLSQNTPNGLQSVNATLAQLLQYLFTNNSSTDGVITDLGYLKQVTTGGLLEGNGKADQPLNVKISPGAGNLLQSRVDGLYYGIEAPADISVLYVDSLLGDDNNNGTTSLTPFKTLDKALSLVNGIMVQTILLKCGDDRPAYITHNSKFINQAGQLYIKAYGDPYLDGEIKQQKEALMAPNNDFRVYHPAASVPIQRPRLISSYRLLSSLGVVTNATFNVYDKAKLVFSNIDLRLRAIDPNNDPFILAWSNAIFYASKDAQVVLEYCYITDDRRYPEVADGGRNIMLNSPASGLGNSSLILTQSRLRVSSSGRAETDYRPIAGVLNSLHQVWKGDISSGFNIEAMTDNIYPIMDQYGEGSVLSTIVRDDVGNVLLPNSDYTHFSHPQSEIVIPNGSVTEEKIASGAVTTSKIANGAVTDDKIQSISASKITGVIPSANLPPASAPVNVIDNLTSNSVNDALSANQGRVLNEAKLNKAGGTITGNLTIEGQTYASTVWIQSTVNNSNMAMSIDSSTNKVLFEHSPISGAGGFKFDKELEAKTEVKSETLKVDNVNNITTISHQFGGGRSLFNTDCNVFQFNKDVYFGLVEKAANGYTTLPNGLIMQWGYHNINNDPGEGGATFIFPVTFPNVCLNATATRATASPSGDNSDGGLSIYAFSNINLQIHYSNYYGGASGSLRGCYWMAIGY